MRFGLACAAWLLLTVAAQAAIGDDINHKAIAHRPGTSNSAQVHDVSPSAAVVAVPPETQATLDRIAKALETRGDAVPATAVAPVEETRPRTALASDAINWFGTIGVIGALQAFLLLAGLVVLWKVRTTAEAGARDAKRGADAAERSALAAERLTVESRIIGEAQARAYVGVKLEKVSFDWPDNVSANPVVEISAANTGRSPARDFVWNATVQYIQSGRRNTASISDDWPANANVTVPAGSTVRDSAPLDLPLALFAGSFEPPVSDVVARVKIAFRYRDVFGNVTEDAAYFIGVAELPFDRMGKPQLPWRGDFYPIAEPADWDAPPVIEAVPAEEPAAPADEPELPLAEPPPIEVALADEGSPEDAPVPVAGDAGTDVEIAMIDIASAVNQAVDDAPQDPPQIASATEDRRAAE